MNFWKILKITSVVALVIILGGLYVFTDEPKQHNSSTSSSSSSNDNSFNGIK